MADLLRELKAAEAALRSVAPQRAELDRQRAQLDERERDLRVEISLLKRLVAQDKEEQGYSPNHRGIRPAAPRAAPNSSSQRKHMGTTNCTRLAGHWNALLREAVRVYPGTLDYDDVIRFHDQRGYKAMTRDNVRRRVHEFVNAELYERVGPGRFRATPRAAQVVGMALGSSDDHQNDEAPNVGAPGASVN